MFNSHVPDTFFFRDILFHVVFLFLRQTDFILFFK